MNRIEIAIKNGTIKIESESTRKNLTDITNKGKFYRKCNKCKRFIKYKTYGALRASFYRKNPPPCRKCFDKKRLSKEGRKQISEKLKGIKFTKQRRLNISRETRLALGLPWPPLPKLPKKTKEELRQLRSEKQKGVSKSKKVRIKMSIAAKKRKHYPHSEKTIRKIRLKTIERLQEKYGKGVRPSFNPYACELIDKYNKLNRCKCKHAKNGGEYYIKELGYFVDGYDKNKNLVIEVDEKHHFNANGDLRKKDIKRMNEIINHLKCKFIRLKDDGTVYLIKEYKNYEKWRT